MQSRLPLIVVLAVSLGGCQCGTPKANPPAPPVSADLDPTFKTALERTDAGLPILIASGASMAPGLSLALVFDATLDDPIARWGQCLSRVGACYQTNPGAPIAGCVAQIEPCADDSGGTQCCAPACLSRFQSLAASGLDEDEAIDQSFIAGDCLTGFTAEDDGGVQP